MARPQPGSPCGALGVRSSQQRASTARCRGCKATELAGCLQISPLQPRSRPLINLVVVRWKRPPRRAPLLAKCTPVQKSEARPSARPNAPLEPHAQRHTHVCRLSLAYASLSAPPPRAHPPLARNLAHVPCTHAPPAFLCLGCGFCPHGRAGLRVTSPNAKLQRRPPCPDG